MDKVAMYKEYIMNKVAMARAWKKHMGSLSPGAESKLIGSGILNHSKELAGLEKGTENIVKKHKGQIGYFSPDEFVEMGRKEYSNNKARKKLLELGGASVDDALNAAKKNFKATGGFMSMSGKHVKAVSKGKLEHDSPISRVMNGVPDKPFDKKYLEALMNRHEADELRFGQKGLVGRKNSAVIDGDKIPIGDYKSHASPKVLGAESANVAIAPNSVRDKLDTARTFSGEKPEIAAAGLDYAKSGKYNKQLNALMQRKTVSFNRDQLREILEL